MTCTITAGRHFRARLVGGAMTTVHPGKSYDLEAQCGATLVRLGLATAEVARPSQGYEPDEFISSRSEFPSYESDPAPYTPVPYTPVKPAIKPATRPALSKRLGKSKAGLNGGDAIIS